MRTLLFFDLPTEKVAQRKAYSRFVKKIKKLGFVMLQESVYFKFDLDQRAADSSAKEVKKFAPEEGVVCLLCITEKQFSEITYIVGESNSNVLTGNDRSIEL